MFCMETALKLLYWSLLVRPPCSCSLNATVFMDVPCLQMSTVETRSSVRLPKVAPFAQVYREIAVVPEPSEPGAEDLKWEDESTQERQGQEVCSHCSHPRGSASSAARSVLLCVPSHAFEPYELYCERV